METLKIPLLAEHRNHNVIVNNRNTDCKKPIQFLRSLCQFLNVYPMYGARKDASPLLKIQSHNIETEILVNNIMQMIEDIKPKVCDQEILRLALEKHFFQYPNCCPSNHEIKLKKYLSGITITFGEGKNKFEYSVFKYYFNLSKYLNFIESEEGLFTNIGPSKGLLFGKVKFSNGQIHIGERQFIPESNSISLTKGIALIANGEKQEGIFAYDPKSKDIRMIKGRIIFDNGKIQEIQGESDSKNFYCPQKNGSV